MYILIIIKIILKKKQTQVEHIKAVIIVCILGPYLFLYFDKPYVFF